jgi:hypothetical protein
MFNENILENDLNEDEVLFDDNIFDDETETSSEDDEDAVDFESFDDGAADW